MNTPSLFLDTLLKAVALWTLNVSVAFKKCAPGHFEGV